MSVLYPLACDVPGVLRSGGQQVQFEAVATVKLVTALFVTTCSALSIEPRERDDGPGQEFLGRPSLDWVCKMQDEAASIVQVARLSLSLTRHCTGCQGLPAEPGGREPAANSRKYRWFPFCQSRLIFQA
jgi:hypothetical protein